MAFVALEDLSDCSSEHQRALPDALGAVLLPHHRVMLVAVSFDRKTRRGDEPSSIIRAQTSAADLPRPFHYRPSGSQATCVLHMFAGKKNIGPCGKAPSRDGREPVEQPHRARKLGVAVGVP
jgi:hypothetical protein